MDEGKRKRSLELGSCCANTEEAFEHAHRNWTESAIWDNPKFKAYVTLQWMRLAEKWVPFHRLKFDVVVTTNHGTEARNTP